MTGGYHLFALVPADAPRPAPLPAGLDGGEVLLLPVGAVAAVAQSVPGDFLARLQQGGAGEAERAWLTDRLLEHERVVEGFAALGPIFPLGFGVLLADPVALQAAIVPHLVVLSTFFARAAGRQEWSLKFFLREQAPKRGQMAMAARSGLDYLAARRAIPERAAAQEAAGRDFVERALGQLRPHCEAMLSRESGTAPSKGLKLLANIALLVPAAGQAALVSAVKALLAPAAAVELEITLTGPWPLYSFRPSITLGSG